MRGKSVLVDVKMTALHWIHEQVIYHATRLVLGGYYKTYGHGTPSVQDIFTKSLGRPEQFQQSLGFGPFVVENDGYNYLSARFPPDAEEFARRFVEMVKRRTL